MKKIKMHKKMIFIILEQISERLSFFTNITGQVFFQSIIFYDIKITSGWFYYTDMFIRCIISPKKIGRSLTKLICVKIRSFRENFNHDQTTFLLAQSLFLTISTSLKWNGGPGWITNIFNVHWGILGAIVSIRIIQR